MNEHLVVKQIDGAELRYLKESGEEDFDPACLKEIVSMIDALLENTESGQ